MIFSAAADILRFSLFSYDIATSDTRRLRYAIFIITRADIFFSLR